MTPSGARRWRRCTARPLSPWRRWAHAASGEGVGFEGEQVALDGFLTFARLGVDGGQFLRAARALGLVGAAKKDRFGCTDYLTWPNVSVMVNPITNPIDDKAYKAAVGEATPIADALNDNAAVQMRTWVQFGGLPHNKTMRRVEMIGKIMRRVEMIGERVLPQLAKLG